MAKRTAEEMEQENSFLRNEIKRMKMKYTHQYYVSSDANIEQELDIDMPVEAKHPQHCLRMVSDQHELDCRERLNTSSYVNVTFEPEEMQAATIGLGINIADQTVYPQSFKVHNVVVNMVARLWHCPLPDDFDKFGCYAGAGTVGSTEACLLAGLCLKFRWRKWYGKRHGLTADQVLGVRPNLVISTQFQAAWEKFFKYMDVQPKIVVPSKKTFKITAEGVREAVDDKTIGVVCIMGNHYGGQYDPVAAISDELDKINTERSLDVGIHVDAASGGFIAPFQKDVPPWDFRVKNVLSISASGHKFGQSVCGTGWVVWRQRKGLSENVAISVSYLGGHADSYTLNFSRPATGIYVQYYKFNRLGREGYEQAVHNQMGNSKYLRDKLKEMTYNGKPRFEILDDGDALCLPVVTACLNPELKLPYDDIDMQHQLVAMHWYVSGYNMSFHDPIEEVTQALFSDAPANQTMFRVVVKNNLTRPLMQNLVECIEEVLKTMDKMGAGFKSMHDKEKQMHGKQKTC